MLSDIRAHVGPLTKALVGALVGGALLVTWFLVTDAADYLTVTPESFTSYYWPRRFGLLLHIFGGATALVTGLVQLWLGFTHRTHRSHRYIGRVYMIGVLLGSTGAVYMGATMPPPIGAYAFGLLGLGIAWVITSTVAYVAIRRGEVMEHRAWMIRSYVVTFGFVTFRVITHTMATLGIGDDNTQTGAAAWLCWTIPLLAAELGLRLNSRSGGQRLQRASGKEHKAGGNRHSDGQKRLRDPCDDM